MGECKWCGSSWDEKSYSTFDESRLEAVWPFPKEFCCDRCEYEAGHASGNRKTESQKSEERLTYYKRRLRFFKRPPGQSFAEFREQELMEADLSLKRQRLGCLFFFILFFCLCTYFFYPLTTITVGVFLISFVVVRFVKLK